VGDDLFSNMPVNIRRYKEEDYGFLLDLFQRSIRDVKRHNPNLTLKGDFADHYLGPTIRIARQRNGFLRIAESDGQPAGFIMVLKKKRASAWDESRTSSALVMELHVHPKHRRHGIGRLLLREAETHYRTKGFDWLTLGVFSRNKDARAFYERVGYHETYLFLGKRLR
jgi:ribosomal protein S18 acetylase RimI-like enzyme